MRVGRPVLCACVLLLLFASNTIESLTILSNTTTLARDDSTGQFVQTRRYEILCSPTDYDVPASFRFVEPGSGVLRNLTILCGRPYEEYSSQVLWYVPGSASLYVRKICVERTLAEENTNIPNITTTTSNGTVVQSNPQLFKMLKHIQPHHMDRLQKNVVHGQKGVRELMQRHDPASVKLRASKFKLSGVSVPPAAAAGACPNCALAFGAIGLGLTLYQMFGGHRASDAAIDHLNTVVNQLGNDVMSLKDNFAGLNAEFIHSNEVQNQLNGVFRQTLIEQKNATDQLRADTTYAINRNLDEAKTYATALNAQLSATMNTIQGNLNSLQTQIISTQADFLNVSAGLDSRITSVTTSFNSLLLQLAANLTATNNEMMNRTQQTANFALMTASLQRDSFSTLMRWRAGIDQQVAFGVSYNDVVNTVSGTPWQLFVNDSGIAPNTTHPRYTNVPIDSVSISWVRDYSGSQKYWTWDRYDLFCNTETVVLSRMTWTTFTDIMTSIGPSGCNSNNGSCPCWVHHIKDGCVVDDTTVSRTDVVPLFRQRMRFADALQNYDWVDAASGLTVTSDVCVFGTTAHLDEIITDPTGWELALRTSQISVPTASVSGQAVQRVYRVYSAQAGGIYTVPYDPQSATIDMVAMAMSERPLNAISLVVQLYMQAIAAASKSLEFYLRIRYGAPSNDVTWTHYPTQKSDVGNQECWQMSMVAYNSLDWQPVRRLTKTSTSGNITVYLDGNVISSSNDVVITPTLFISPTDARFIVGDPASTTTVYDVPSSLIVPIDNAASREGTLGYVSCPVDPANRTLASIGCGRAGWNTLYRGSTFNSEAATVTADLFANTISNGVCSLPRSQGSGSICELFDYYIGSWDNSTQMMRLRMKSGHMTASVVVPEGFVFTEITGACPTISVQPQSSVFNIARLSNNNNNAVVVIVEKTGVGCGGGNTTITIPGNSAVDYAYSRVCSPIGVGGQTTDSYILYYVQRNGSFTLCPSQPILANTPTDVYTEQLGGLNKTLVDTAIQTVTDTVMIGLVSLQQRQMSAIYAVLQAMSGWNTLTEVMIDPVSNTSATQAALDALNRTMFDSIAYLDLLRQQKLNTSFDTLTTNFTNALDNITKEMDANNRLARETAQNNSYLFTNMSTFIDVLNTSIGFQKSWAANISIDFSNLNDTLHELPDAIVWVAESSSNSVNPFRTVTSAIANGVKTAANAVAKEAVKDVNQLKKLFSNPLDFLAGLGKVLVFLVVIGLVVVGCVKGFPILYRKWKANKQGTTDGSSSGKIGTSLTHEQVEAVMEIIKRVQGGATTLSQVLAGGSMGKFGDRDEELASLLNK